VQEPAYPDERIIGKSPRPLWAKLTGSFLILTGLLSLPGLFTASALPGGAGFVLLPLVTILGSIVSGILLWVLPPRWLQGAG